MTADSRRSGQCGAGFPSNSPRRPVLARLVQIETRAFYLIQLIDIHLIIHLILRDLIAAIAALEPALSIYERDRNRTRALVRFGQCDLADVLPGRYRFTP